MFRYLTVIKLDAGVADLDVTATSPLGQELPLQVTSLNDGAEMIEFSPSVPGSYMVNVTYGEIQSFFLFVLSNSHIFPYVRISFGVTDCEFRKFQNSAFSVLFITRYIQ